MNQVKVTDEIRRMPAYAEPSAEEMPMFAENRVHQRSSGNPYPNRVVMQVDRTHREERPFRVITLENEYLRLELMPELGGRIHAAMDKRTGYDFFYRQHVIKPALIGLLGSWISGGCEFNWPCHHRPGTFRPVDTAIERHADGAVTVWMSENEPLDRMKGMVGIHLAPGEARFDTRMRVYNGTPVRHSFLWWENAAVPVNEKYRLIFPPDVHYVQFHYRKNVTTYPVASGVYNGIRMGQGTDISWHKNTHQPTSYFCAPTAYDFFGGYDEGRQAGVIHVADHTVSVGKKMFTWAYNQLSSSWEKALTDSDGPYAELMASSYSLNQPDFTWLQPYEGREFSQMWYPVGPGGAPVCACRECAVSFREGELLIRATVPITEGTLITGGRVIPFEASPEQEFRFKLEGDPRSLVIRWQGRTLLRYEKPTEEAPVELPATIPDNPSLDQLRMAQELYLMGVHAEQYRDPATRPEGYYREALRRDPEYVPALTALAERELNHFRPKEAYRLARKAWEKETVRNFHPESGRLQYVMGRILEALDREEEAFEWYMQAAWQQDARSRALTRAAMVRLRAGDREEAARLAGAALEEHGRNEHAWMIRFAAGDANALETLEKYDPLHVTARALRLGATPAFFAGLRTNAADMTLDAAQDLWEMGKGQTAAELLSLLPEKTAMLEYVRAFLKGDPKGCDQARALPTGIAYPSRSIEEQALRWAVDVHPTDDRALELLGCLRYANESYQEAERLWALAAEKNPEEPLHLRNLAVARYSHLGRREEAVPLLTQALERKPHDGQLIWEKAHVMIRRGYPGQEIAAFLDGEAYTREDIAIEHCRALNMSGQYVRALALMEKRQFTPCEGGEHAVAEQYMFAHHALGRELLEKNRPEEALIHFRAAQSLPENLGAGLWNEVLLVPHRYFEALCLQRMEKPEEAEKLLDWILILKQDYFSDMHLPELPCWQAMALRLRNRDAEAKELLAAHLRAQEMAERKADPGYAKTTPFFLSYMEDAAALRQAGAAWQRAMAHFAFGDRTGAGAYAMKTLKLDPACLYAWLLVKEI